MPRISRLKRNEVTEPVGVIYDRYVQQRGSVPNMFRTIAHRPEILETMIAHFEAILTTGTLSTKLKELVIVRTSQLNACEYCLASHSLIARNWAGMRIRLPIWRTSKTVRFHTGGKSSTAPGRGRDPAFERDQRCPVYRTAQLLR